MEGLDGYKLISMFSCGNELLILFACCRVNAPGMPYVKMNSDVLQGSNPHSSLNICNL